MTQNNDQGNGTFNIPSDELNDRKLEQERREYTQPSDVYSSSATDYTSNDQAPYVPSDAYPSQNASEAPLPAQNTQNEQSPTFSAGSASNPFNSLSHTDPYDTAPPTSANSYTDPYSTQYTHSDSTNFNSPYSANGPQFNTVPQEPSQLNIKALLGLIFSIVFFPVGLVLSWLGYKEAKEENDDTGKILGIIGLVISGIQTAFFILSILFFVFIMFMGILGSM